MTLDYREDWPRLENVAAQAEFRNQGMSVKVTSALAGPLKVDAAQRAVRRLQERRDGSACRRARRCRRCARLPRRHAARCSGGARLLERAGHRALCNAPWTCSFRSSNSTRGACWCTWICTMRRLKRRGASVAATNIAGTADIDGAQVVRADLHGQLLGGPVQMTARAPRSRAAMRTQLEFHGTSSGESLRAALATPQRRCDRRSNGLARGAAHVGGAGARAFPAYHFEPRRTRARAPCAAAQSRRRVHAGDGGYPMAGAGRDAAASRAGVACCASDVTFDDNSSGTKLARAAVWFGGGEPPVGDAAGLTVGGQIEELDLAGWLKLTRGRQAGEAPCLVFPRGEIHARPDRLSRRVACAT